jgi:hypothetical protein
MRPAIEMEMPKILRRTVRRQCIMKILDTQVNELLCGDLSQLPLMLNEKQAARMLNVSLAFLRQARCKGKRDGRALGPRFVKLNDSVKYKKGELLRWVEQLPEQGKNPIGGD